MLIVGDIDLFELNEAFAASPCRRRAGSGSPAGSVSGREGENLNGGAIAWSHPLTCSGARISATLINLMEEDAPQGVATMCIGLGGQGMRHREQCNECSTMLTGPGRHHRGQPPSEQKAALLPGCLTPSRIPGRLLPTLLCGTRHTGASCRRNLRVGRPVWGRRCLPAVGANPEDILPANFH